MKKYLDRMLYKKLSEQSGRTLAWGILMGVRPTKIAMRKLEEGMTQETFVPWFQKENLVSEEKAHLALQGEKKSFWISWIMKMAIVFMWESRSAQRFAVTVRLVRVP